MPSGVWDGRTINQSGQVPARVSLSVRQAKELGLLTSGTYGLHSSISLSNADLTLCLVNKLRAKTASVGSNLYKLTWRERITPQQRLIFALRASVLRTSDSDFIGWPTPTSKRSSGEWFNGHPKRWQKSDVQQTDLCNRAGNSWRNADWISCRDGKQRPVESGTFPLANGIANRVGRLRAYGNAIVAPVAETFISAYIESEKECKLIR